MFNNNNKLKTYYSVHIFFEDLNINLYCQGQLMVYLFSNFNLNNLDNTYHLFIQN